jgi:hypothetical protein
MNKSKVIFVALVAAAVAVGTYVWRRSGNVSAPPATIAEIQAPQAGIIPEVRVSPAAAAPGQPAAEAVATSKPDPSDPVAYDIEMRKRNPNYIGAIQGKAAMMQLQYPDLARELGMTPAEAEALYDLLMKQQSDVAKAAELDALLAGHQQQWKDYQQTLDARRRVSELTNMVNTTSPMSEQQARMLVSTVVAEQQRRANELRPLGTPRADDPRAQLEFDEAAFKAREESNRRTVEAARAYLDEQQVTIMKNAMEGQNTLIRSQLQGRRMQLERSAGR